MKLSVFKFLYYPGLVLVFLAAFMGCSEDDIDSLADCGRGIDYYMSEAQENTNEQEIIECEQNASMDVFSNTTFLLYPVFSPVSDNKIVFLKRGRNPGENNINELLLLDLCKGTETVLDSDWRNFGNITWTDEEWIYFGKESRHYRIRPTGENLEDLDIPTKIQAPIWNKNRDRVMYTKQLVLSQRLIIADADFNPIDSSDIHRFVGPYAWLSNEEIVFSFYNEDTQAGVYKFNIKNDLLEILHKIDKCQSVPNFSIGKNADEIFWKTGGDIYQTNTKTQFTNNLISDSQGSFFNWISKSPNSNLLLSIRTDIELFEECKGKVQDYLTVINVESREVNYIEL